MSTFRNLLAALGMALAIVALGLPVGAAETSAQPAKGVEASAQETSADNTNSDGDQGDGGMGFETTPIYSVNRTPEDPFDTARAVDVITAEDIWRSNARTLPGVLMERAGIFVQYTNYGGGAPIIRGLMGKQILILVDGVRMNNATYRFGPIQYLNMIDLELVERIEVVRGANSVLSGGVALGGIINIITKKGPPQGDSPSVGGSVSGRYSQADSGAIGHVQAYGKGEKYRYLVGGTYRNRGDLDGGGSIGEQAYTGYDESGGNLNVEFFPTDEKTLSFRYQTLEQDEVPRTDRLASGRNLQFDFNPQRLQLAAFVYSDLTARRWTDSVQLTLSWNRQDEGRQEIRSNRPTMQRVLDDGNTMLGLNLELGNFLGDSHRLVYGVDYFTEDIESSRVDVNLETGATSTKRGQFTDGASYETLGIYLQDRFDATKRLQLTLGTRFNLFRSSGIEDSSIGLLDLAGTGDELTGSLSAVYQATTSTHLVGSLTRSFRAPNIDDVSVFDPGRPDGTEVPNPGLSSETSLAFELGVKHTGARFKGSAVYYRSNLSNLIERSAGMFLGLPFLDENGNGIFDPDELAVLQKQNIGQSTISGFEMDFRLRVARQWSLFGNFTNTTGDDIVTDAPLSRIPPPFGTFGVRWSGRGGVRPWGEVVYHFAGAQRRVSNRDAADDRIGPNGTDGFNVFHVRSGLTLGKWARLTLGVENLFDEQYKYHGSGFFRPGIQVVFGAQLSF